MTAIEVLIVKHDDDDGHLEILLTERAGDDPNWPGKLHSPGTMLRGSDFEALQNYEPAFQRVLKEIGVSSFSFGPILVDAFPTPTRRGPENSLVFMAQIADRPPVGKFYRLNFALNIASMIVPEQMPMLKRVEYWYVTEYTRRKAETR